MEDFATWLVSELEKRGWSRAEAARRGGISSVAIDRVVNGSMNPGYRFTRGIAQAFGISDEEVARRAGLLPKMGEWPARLNDLARRVTDLADVEQQTVMDVLEMAVKLAEMRYRPEKVSDGESQ